MAKPTSILIVLATLAGCTSTGVSSEIRKSNAECTGLSWSWCVGYHGDH